MVNRRSFFQSLGAAILGTAIALKIPDSLIPQRPILPDATIGGITTWSMLEREFNKIRLQNSEPSIIIVNRSTFEYFRNRGYC